jgi:DNA-binding transcriptional LysR family regulator
MAGGFSLDELVSMAVFARVVEARSFTGAAARLGLSKSAVSTRVAHLEDQIGARLLHRTTRRLTLTDAGMRFYERCARLVAAADDAALAAAGVSSEPRGLLRVAAPVAFGQMQLATVFADFLAAWPGVRLEVALEDRHVDLVAEGIDLAIRVTRPRDSSLVASRLASDRMVVCAAPSYLARRGTPSRPEELLHHNCLRYAHLRVAEEWRFREGSREFSVPVSGDFVANDAALLRESARAGLGITILPSSILGPDLEAGWLRSILDDFSGAEIGVYAMYPHRQHVPPAVRALVAFLAQRFRAAPWARGRGR